jgi:hypothetical protein
MKGRKKKIKMKREDERIKSKRQYPSPCKIAILPSSGGVWGG